MELKKSLKVYVLVIAMLMCSMFGLVACGNPHKGMKITLESENLVKNEESGKYTASLVIELDENQMVKPESNFTFTAKVEGGADTISRKVDVVPNDSTKVTVVSNVYNEQENVSTITLQPVAKTEGDFETYVSITSSETSEITERIYLNITKPATGVLAKEDTNLAGLANGQYYGVPAGQKISLNPEDIFEFAPKDATVPALTYEIGGLTYEDLTEVYIPLRNEAEGGFLEINAYSTENPENTAMQATVYLRVYETIDEANFTIKRDGFLEAEDDVTEIELIKNSQAAGANLAVLALSCEHYKTDSDEDVLEYALDCDGSVIGEILNITPHTQNKDGEIIVTSLDGIFNITGITATTEPIEIKAQVRYKNIVNSPVIEKVIKISVVDYPKNILINKKVGTNLVSINVYDHYTGVVRGTELNIELAPFSEGKGQYRFEVVYDADPKYQPTDALLGNVQIKTENASDEEAFTLLDCDSEEMVFESGTKLLLKLIDGNIMGHVLVKVYSVAVNENALFEQKLERNIEISLGKGVEGFYLSPESVDPTTNTVYLQIAKIKNANSDVDISEKILTYHVEPTNASASDVVVESLNTDIVQIVEVTPSGNFTIRALKPGNAEIKLSTSNGVTKKFKVTVLEILGAVGLDVNVSDQSEKIAETNYEDKNYEILNEESGEYDIKNYTSLIKLVAVKGKTINLGLNFYPSSASPVGMRIISDIESIAYATAGTNYRNIILNTRNAGIANLTVYVYYDCLNLAGNALYKDGTGNKKYFEFRFVVEVYEPITSLNLSKDYVELLIGETPSYYDRQQGVTTVTATLNPINSTIKADEVNWTVANYATVAESYITISNGASEGVKNIVGKEITISTTNKRLPASSLEILVVVTITDKNNRTITEQITVIVKQIVRVIKTNVSNYDSKQGIYFEESKGFYNPVTDSTAQSHLLDVSVVSASLMGSVGTATNNNLEYLLFDATVDANGNWKALERNTEYAEEKFCSTALLRYNEDEKKWQIEPKSAGYAILYIVPQDSLKERAEDILDARFIESSTYAEIHITMSDGSEENRYRLYTAQDVVSMGSGGGLDKHYYLMNNIDMSGVMAELSRKNQKWTAIGNTVKSFTGSITTWDNYGAITDNNKLIISGWNFDVETQTDGELYGIFGIIGKEAKISNIHFDITNFNIKHNASQSTYFYGALAGEVLGTLDNVTVSVRNMQISGSSNRNLYVGVIGKADSGQVWKNNNQQQCSSYITNLVANWTATSVVGEGSYALSVYYGGVVGINYGALGKEDGSISATVAVVAENVNANTSAFGGVVAENSDVYKQSGADNTTIIASKILNVSANGYIDAMMANVAGGVAAINYGSVTYAESSVQLKDATTMGGVIGLNQSKEPLNYCYYNAFKNAGGGASILRSQGRVNATVIGGLVGVIEVVSSKALVYNKLMPLDNFSASIENSYAMGFSDEANIKVVGSNIVIGGLVGRVRIAGKVESGEQPAAVSIDASFADLNIDAQTATGTDDFVGGMVGDVVATSSLHALYLSNSFASGNVTTLGLVPAHFVARNQCLVGVSSIYSKSKHSVNGVEYYKGFAAPTLNGVSGGVYSSSVNAVILAEETPGEDVKDSYVPYYLKSTEMKGQLLGNYGFDFASQTARWASVDENTNNGYPIPTNTEGVRLYPYIPTDILLTAKQFNVLNNGFVNSIINIAPNENKIIISLSENNTYNLLDLFNATIMPSTLNADSLEVMVQSSNLGVIQPVSATYLSGWEFITKGYGTAILTITALKNPNASCTVQICVVKGFDSWALFENADAELSVFDYTKPYNISLKLGTSMQMIAKFYNSSSQITASDSGVLVLVKDATIFDINDISYVNFNYNGDHYYAVYADSASILTFTTLAKISGFECIVLPYVIAEFYDASNNPFTTRIIINEESLRAELEFEVYQGSTDLTTTLAGTENEPNNFEADQEITFDINLTTDSTEEQAMGVAYGLEVFTGANYEADKNKQSLWVVAVAFETIMQDDGLGNYYMALKSKIYDNVQLDANTTINFNEMFTYNISSPIIWANNKGVTQQLRFMLENNFVKTMTKDYYLRFTFGGMYGGTTVCENCQGTGILAENGELCVDCRGTGTIANVAKTVYVKITPQGVTRIDIAHFSDAEAEGNYITNAGELPNNAIIAGEYGLLRITVSPDYAYYDEVQVYSSTAEGDVISFDQRVAYGKYDENDIKQVEYHSYQAGVTVLDNGISLSKVSNKHLVSVDETTGKETYSYSFDGTYYLRTLIANYITTAASFDVTVVVLRNGKELSRQTQTISVEKVSDLSVGFYSYHSAKSSAYIAAQTGGIEQTNVYNQNEFVITTVGEFDSIRLKVSSDEISDLNFVKIEQVGTRYFIKLGAESSNYLGKKFRITVYGTKNMNGYLRTIPRSMNFTIVNFLVMGLVVDKVSSGVYSQVYTTNKEYDLRIVADFSKISYNEIYKDEILAFFDKLNGVGDLNQIIQPWYYQNESGGFNHIIYVDDKDSTNKFICNDVFYLLYRGNAEVTTENPYANVWKIVPQKYGEDQVIQLLVNYGFEDGKLVYYENKTENADSIVFTQDLTITLNFTQRSSLDHPMPIYTKAEFLGMKENGNYILMNDLDFTYSNDGGSVEWSPITTQIASLDGNGRTVIIRTINTKGESKNFGLFDTIGTNTVIKNLNLKLYNEVAISFNLEDTETFNFGAFAAVNKGIISNCAVIGSSSRTDEKLGISINFISNANSTNNNLQNIAGFVADNQGNITNSRVEKISISTHWGNLAGFAVNNSGVIAGSYFKGTGTDGANGYGVLRNLSDVPQDEYVSTSGFVGYNETNAKILTSYTGGAFTEVDESGKITLKDSSLLYTLRDGAIYADYYISGFVFENAGEVSDCYSSMYISGSNYSSGFVFKNKGTGTIKRAYSTSLLKESSRSQTPFIGTTAMGTSVKNNNENISENSIQSCFFYNFGCPDEALLAEVASPLSKEQFINQDGDEFAAWQDFAVSRMTNSVDGSEYTGVWTFVQQNNEYFNTERFTTNFGPKLVAADVVSKVSGIDVFMTLDTEKTYFDAVANETVYVYNYAVANNIAESTNLSFAPFIITTSEQLNSLLVNNTPEENSAYNNSWFRLANNIDLNEIKESSEGVLQTISTVFAGNFDGNGFNITIPDIISETQTGQTGVENIENVGFVSQIITNANSLGAIKSLNLTVDDLSAGLITNVGTLAGKVENGYVSNINVKSVMSNQSMVTGGNNVGGVIGKVSGSSRVINISADISVSSTFGSPTNVDPDQSVKGLIYNADILRLFNNPDAVNSTLGDTASGYYNPDNKLSYAGGIIGVVDIVPFEGARNVDSYALNSSLVSGLKVTGNNSVIGINVGGIVGLVGSSSVVNFAEKEVFADNKLKSTGYAGGIVGENHGYLRYSQLYYTSDIQEIVDNAIIGELPAVANFNLFTGMPVAVGGLIGLNYGLSLEEMQTGYVYSSNNRVRVSSENASLAGGLVGVSLGGNMKALFTSASVRGAQDATVGGAFGYVGTLNNAVVDWNLLQNPFKNVETKLNELDYDNIKNQALTISYVVAQNNWAATDYYIYDNLDEYNAYIGGVAGYVSNNGAALAVIHKSIIPEGEELDDAPDPIYNSSETNFFVNKIYSNTIAKTAVSANNIPVNVSSNVKVMELNAIGNISTAENEELDHAKGLVRNYMVSADGKKRMFGNWALYSFSKDENGQFTYDGYGSPEFNRDTVPDTIYITDLGQIRNIMTYELDRNYVLLNDINCEGGTFIIGDSNTNCFSGELDGNGFTIYNFTANTGVDHVAFFGVTKNAYIHDVDFFNMQINSTSINPTSTASFVVGKATDTVMEKVNVVEEFNGNNIKSVLTSSAAYTGGLVGYAVSDEIKNIHTRKIDYNNGSLAGYYPNNLYYLCFVTGDIVVKDITKDFGGSVGGLFGEIKGQNSTEVDYTIKVDDVAGIQNTVVVDKSAFVGNIEVSGINALKNSYEINIGGFAGKATKSTILQSYTKADINATQLTGDLYIGGFAGSLVEGVTYKTLNNGDVVVHTKDNKVNSTNEDLISVVNIGGYAGYTSAYTWVATTTTNVVFTSDDKYEKTSTQQCNSTTFHQNIGGFAGGLSFDNTFKTENTYLSLENILSLTSVYNYTTMARVDSFAYEIEGGSITNTLGKFNFLVYENYYSLSASNRMKGFGVRGASRELTTTVWEGSLLDYQGKADDKGNQEKYFLQNNSSDRAYPVMQFVGLTDLQFADKTDLTNSLFTQYYDVFSGGTSTERGVKNKPILLEKVLPNNNGVSDGQQEYKYYMQNGEVKIDPSTQNNFYGFYNNAGQNIQMDSFDYLYGTPTADHFSYAKNIGMFNNLLDKSSTVEKPYGTVVSGVTMKNVKISFTSYADTDINYGIVACGNVESNSIIYGAQTDGFMEITKNGHIATLSGIANNNEGQIIASTSSIDFAINDTTNTTNFVVGGIVANQNSVLKYGLSDCYFGGSIIINTNKVIAGGVIGDCSKTLLYARNAYTYGDITNTGTSTTVQAFVGKIGTVAPSSSELYFERGTSTVNSVAGKIVAYYSSEAYTTKPLETNFAKYGWAREQRANYGFPYLSCIQEFKSYDAETSQVYFSGDGSENTPYILKNEGQLVWALTNSSNVYYKLERDMDYNIIKEIYDVKGINPTSVTFKGKLDGVGKSIVNSSGVLVNSIAANASVTALGFKNVNGTGKTLLANNVLGKISSAYLNDTNATNYLVDTITSTGVVSDSLTEGATLFKTNSGTQQNCYKPSELATLGLTTYEGCLQNDRNMDFFNTWIWLPTNASATNEISAVEGKPQLRSFIETWDEKDMSLYSNNQNFKDATVTVDEATQLTTIAMKVDSVEELVRISQYIARNAGLNTLYELTFNSANDYNFNAMRLNPIGLGRAQNLHFKIVGNNSVFYNLVLDDLNVSNATGLFGRLNSLSDVQDIVFNNVSLKTKIYGGVLTGTNAGIVNNVQVNNSWLLGTGGLGEDKRAVLGGVIGSNLGSVANSSATNLIIDSHAGSVGGLLGENIYNKDNTSAIVLSSSVVNTKINSNANNQNTSKEDWLEMTKIGGFVGEHSKISDAVPLSESSVYGTYIMGYQEIGGFAGSSTFTTASGVTGDGTISNVFVGSRDGLSKTQVVGKTFVYNNENFASSKVGGIVGNNGLNLFGVQFAGDITVTGDNVGGIAGVFDARNQSVEINGSYVRETTNITGVNNVGGYVGYSINGKLGSAGRVNVVENNVTITGVNNVGGLVGQNGIIDESGASISGNYSSIFYNRVGVTAGSGRITISGQENVGGLVGLTHNEIRPDATGLNEVNKVTINATKSNIGGAVGTTDDNVGHVTKINITDAVINLNGENQTNVGGFMGYAEDSVFAYVVNASNIIINSANNVDKLGGLIGYNKGIMGVSEGTADTLNTVNITVGVNSVNVGGAIGYNTGEFLNLIGRGLSVSGGYHEIGGVVGYNGGKVGNYITSTGINKVEVTNITFANLNAESYNVGGFVGFNDTNAVVEVSRVLNNRSDGGFTIQGATKLGGFVGYNKGMVGTDITTYYDTCVADASVIGEDYIGGFVGLNEGKIESSYAHEVAANGANITATGDTTNSVSGQIVNAGGFVGYNATGAEINTSFSAVGAVVGVNGNYYHNNVGGFAGYNDGVLTDIYNYYYVDGNDTGSGRSTNSVDGYENVGGLIGYNSTNGVLSNSNTTGIYGNHATVKGQGMVGGVVGYNNGGSVQHYSNYASVTGTMHEPNGLTKNIAYATYFANPTTLSALNTPFSTYAIGGIVGINYGGLVGYANNYSNVIGGAFVGGVAGINEGVSGKTATLTNVFAYSTTYPKEGVATETVNVTIVGARFMRGAPADIYIPEYLNLDRTPSLLLNKDGNYIINNLNGTDIDWDSSASSNTTTTKLFTYQANTNKIGAGKLVGVQNNYAQTSYYGQTDNTGASAMVYVQFNTVTEYCAKTALMSGGIIGNSGDSYTGINGTVTLLGGVEP